MNTKNVLGVIGVILLLAVGSYWWLAKGGNVTAPEEQKVTYTNNQYGFAFSLPESWNGYSLLTEEWEGSTSTPSGNAVIERGPSIMIRNPSWTAQDPHQDIPIMVFTLAQWDALTQDRFHIGAAPINPTELGRNSRYVFALPARYNFAYLEGWEEVQSIIDSKSLRAF